MVEIVWSPRSIDDVESIRDYIGRDSPWYGALIAAEIIQSVERLGRFPESGRVAPELGDPALREVLW